jgi:hypothetical protein
VAEVERALQEMSDDAPDDGKDVEPLASAAAVVVPPNEEKLQAPDLSFSGRQKALMEQFRATWGPTFKPTNVLKSGRKGTISDERDDFLTCLKGIAKKHLDRNQLVNGQWYPLHLVQTEFETTEWFKWAEFDTEVAEEFDHMSIMRTMQLWHNR